jgi:hypothetical protein
MDPNATLDRLLDAIMDGDMTEAGYALEDLTGWIYKGGFKPRDPRTSEDRSPGWATRAQQRDHDERDRQETHA